MLNPGFIKKYLFYMKKGKPILTEETQELLSEVYKNLR